MMTGAFSTLDQTGFRFVPPEYQFRQKFPQRHNKIESRVKTSSKIKRTWQPIVCQARPWLHALPVNLLRRWAAPLAGLMRERARHTGQRAATVFSGANIDATMLTKVLSGRTLQT
jgi:hypothetical protein